MVSVKKIIAKLQHEHAEYVVRDISFLTCTVFTDTHLASFKKIFGFDNFTFFFWFINRDNQAICYRSFDEYLSMAEKIGKKYLKDYKFAKKAADTLIEYSDEINDFISKNKKINDLRNNWDHFRQLYQDFFAYHQAVYWPSEYLLKIKDKKKQRKIKKIVDILDRAYKYNETVVPNVEKYFARMKVADMHYDEVVSGKSGGKNRSVILLDGKVKTLNYPEAEKIHKAIQRDYAHYLKDYDGIKGVTAQKGLAHGKVRLVVDLKDLAKCKKGDVLVTTQTRPQYNSAIKNVAAIVTDEGGMLCHASMLAREFKIPCIVGTKIATKALKNGQIAEVDAENGVVRIIK